MATPQEDDEDFFTFENEVVFVEDTEEVTEVSFDTLLFIRCPVTAEYRWGVCLTVSAVGCCN